MKVYILEEGCYEQRTVAGVYDSPERAMAAVGGHWTRTIFCHYPQWPSRDRPFRWQEWSNGLDWENAATITEKEIETEGELSELAPIVEQRLNNKDDWDYIAIDEERAAVLLGEGGEVLA